MGRITATHGLRGEMKVEPWCDSPQDLGKLKTLYADGTAYAVVSVRVQGQAALLKLQGVESVEAAQTFKGTILQAAREDLKLSPGSYFLTDCEGATVVDAESGAVIGKAKQLLFYPGRAVLEVDAGRELLIPMVSEFIKEVDADNGIVRVRLIDGM